MSRNKKREGKGMEHTGEFGNEGTLATSCVGMTVADQLNDDNKRLFDDQMEEEKLDKNLMKI